MNYDTGVNVEKIQYNTRCQGAMDRQVFIKHSVSYSNRIFLLKLVLLVIFKLGSNVRPVIVLAYTQFC